MPRPKKILQQFTHWQVEKLRNGLEDYRKSFLTNTKGNCLSWVQVAENIILSESNDLDFPETTDAEDEIEHARQKKIFKRDKIGIKEEIDKGWPITGEQLERFKRGQTKTPSLVVLNALQEFLIEISYLPPSFKEEAFERFAEAFTMSEYFSKGVKDNFQTEKIDFLGKYKGRVELDDKTILSDLAIHRYENNEFFEVDISASKKTDNKIDQIIFTGWGVIPSFNGILLFLQRKEGRKTYQQMYLGHSISLKNDEILKLNILPYKGLVGNITQMKTSKKEKSKNLIFINELPESFDKEEPFMKTSKKRVSSGFGPAVALKDDLFVKWKEKQGLKMEGKKADADFLWAVLEGDTEQAKYFLEQGVDINCRVSGSNRTALHLAAGSQDHDMMKVLCKNKELRYLVRDIEGALPSELAMRSPDNVGLGAYLKWKEIKEAGGKAQYRASIIEHNKRGHEEPEPSI